MSENGKIYTKGGDKGQTSLIGGKRVPKYHDRVEAYGTLDELNSWVGLIRDQDIGSYLTAILIKIQNSLFIIQSLLAAGDEKTKESLPQLQETDISLLENEIDKMNEGLPVINSFILPGGHIAVSYCHIARCVCRRSERIIVKLSKKNIVDRQIFMYINRLSDYLFILSRKISKDFHVVETLWKQGK